MANGQTHGAELWVKDLSSGDLSSGKVDRVVPGYPMQSNIERLSYSISQDGKQVAFTMMDQSGRSSLWVAPTNHRSSPRHISSAAVEDTPLFLPDGDLVFRATEGGSNFLYRMKADGTGRHKVFPDRILTFVAVSPDGRWVVAASANPDDEEHPASVKAFALDGSSTTTFCTIECHLKWDATGKFIYLDFPALSEGSYVLPVMHSGGLPKTPPAGFATKADLANAKAIPWYVGSALNPSVYAYTRVNTRRNLYRIPLP